MSDKYDSYDAAMERDLADSSAAATDVMDALVAENQRLRDIEQKARAFVATTSYYRQTKDSQPEFEALAFALVALDGTPSEIVPLLDADLNPINREDDHA
jgi:hypothetical protein